MPLLTRLALVALMVCPCGCHYLVPYEPRTTDMPTAKDGSLDRPAPHEERTPWRDLPLPKRDGPAPKPDKAAPKLDKAAPKPDKLVPKADKAVPKPDKSVPKPDKSVPKPDLFVPKPDLFVPKPDKSVPDFKVPQPTWKWKAMTSGTGEDINGVWGVSSAEVYAAGDKGYTHKFNGTSWAKTTISAGSVDFKAVWGIGALAHYLGHRPTGKGECWIRRKITPTTSTGPHCIDGTDRELLGVHGKANNKVYAVGSKGLIYRLNGNTNTWNQLNVVSVSSSFRAVHADTTSRMVIVGGQGIVRLLVNEALSQQATAPGKPELTGVWLKPGGGGVYITAHTGHIFHYNMATSVTQALYDPGTVWEGIHGNSKKVLWAVGRKGNNGRVVRYYNKWGTPYSVKGTAKLELNAVWVADDQKVFAVGKAGAIWRYAKQP